MAYKKQYKKRAPKSSGFSSYVKMIPGILKSISFIMGMLNCEKKRFDYHPANAPVYTTARLNCITDIDAGDDDGQRNGSSILGKSIDFRYNITRGVADTWVRIILFWAKDDAAPSGSTLLTDPTDYQSTLNQDYLHQYNILIDKVFTVTATTAPLISFHKFIKLGDKHHLRYTGVGFGTQVRGNLYLFEVGNNTLINAPVGDPYTRLCYYDN